MRRLLSLTLLLTLAAAAGAADAPKHNTLTPKEIAEGWILLFDGETTFGWRSPNDSQWTIAEGMLAPQAETPGLLVTTSPFRDYMLVFDYQHRPNTKAEVLIGCDADGRTDPNDVIGRVIDLRSNGGSTWMTAEVEIRGGYVQSQVFRSVGAAFAQATARPALGQDRKDKTGFIALSGNGVVFRNIKLIPLKTTPLFNGKDLTGWKEFPGKKSQFSVTKEGAIGLKDGPGDLQSDGQWADFLLQLECISNGDHCNSGVFFRCRPGEYQQGYEAQIRNEFKGEATQEYTIEEYDPKTHELKGTKKEKYTAVDYGTGGIYRRQPARKELAKDREWFGMTIVASGRHLAVWVNGIQASDWTDDRPSADNARKGCYLEKGPISLQGHDATTDLGFRNIRIADLAPPAEEKKP